MLEKQKARTQHQEKGRRPHEQPQEVVREEQADHQSELEKPHKKNDIKLRAIKQHLERKCASQNRFPASQTC